MLAAWMAKPVRKALRARMDPGKYNGASLLGLTGIVIKSHGSADESRSAGAGARAGRGRERRAAAHRRADGADAGRRGGAMIYSRIVGTGSYLPPRVMTTTIRARGLETSDAWIRERTGIAQRHIRDESQTSSDLPDARSKRSPPACRCGGAST
jgi:hypothetical protein